MKVARTFTIDFLVATQLKDVKNQSAFVNAAVKARLAVLDGGIKVLEWEWYQCPDCFTQKKDRIGDNWVFCECNTQMCPISGREASQ